MNKIFMRAKNDCYTACLATVLGVPYEQVPRFFDDDDMPVAPWSEVLNSFLEPRGLQLISLDIKPEHLKSFKGLVIVAGLSYTEEYRKENQYHAVIYKDGELWHDPKPNPTGVIEPSVIDLLFPILGGERHA